MNFFGYGSLVNDQTHEFTGLSAVELKGWVRVWHHRTSGKRQNVTSLSIVPKTGTNIDGLLMQVSPEQRETLDQREAGYRRIMLTPPPTPTGANTSSILTYQSEDPQLGNVDFPILQSYLDTVLQGFARHFGDGSILRFLETTDGWEAPILKDRQAPIYPRATEISEDEARAFDQALQAHGVHWID